uniref:SEA domain-containing protein n=1 Tax=Macrostomum lignano TaxID=282301 RepID=A0A1I8J4U4_9PLAT
MTKVYFLVFIFIYNFLLTKCYIKTTKTPPTHPQLSGSGAAGPPGDDEDVGSGSGSGFPSGGRLSPYYHFSATSSSATTVIRLPLFPSSVVPVSVKAVTQAPRLVNPKDPSQSPGCSESCAMMRFGVSLGFQAVWRHDLARPQSGAFRKAAAPIETALEAAFKAYPGEQTARVVSFRFESASSL